MMVGAKTAFGSHPCQQFFKLVTSGSFAVPAELRVGTPSGYCDRLRPPRRARA